MAGVRNKAIYETTITGQDVSSGQKVVNIVYNAVEDPGTGAGAVLAGSDEGTFIANLKTAWEDNVVAVLSVRYTTESYRTRAIIGWRWPTGFLAVVGATPALTFTSITTGSPHGYASGISVSIQNTVGITGLNGVFSPITVTSPTTFTIPVALTGTLTVVGDVQAVVGAQELHYVDNLEISGSQAGGITGDSLPAFCTASVRRINSGVGRNWRSHIALGPLGESQVKNGFFESTPFTAFQTAMLAWGNPISVGGGFAASHYAISKKIAFGLPSDLIATFSLWSQQVSAFDTRHNMGSQISRKPPLFPAIG